MAKPRAMRCVCGPNRHIILGVAYVPGESSVEGKDGEVVLTADNVAREFGRFIDKALREGALNPFCGLCGARRPGWIFEDLVLKAETYAQAEAEVLEMERRENAKREFLRAGRN